MKNCQVGGTGRCLKTGFLASMPNRASKTYSQAGRHNRAFTLIEMMISLMVLVVGLLAVFALLTLGIQVDSESGHYSIARSVAVQQMEYVRSLSYSSVAALGSSSTIPLSGSQPAQVTNGINSLPGGSGTVAVTTISASGTGLAQVTITISWTEPGRGSDSITLETDVAEGGLNKL